MLALAAVRPAWKAYLTGVVNLTTVEIGAAPVPPPAVDVSDRGPDGAPSDGPDPPPPAGSHRRPRGGGAADGGPPPAKRAARGPPAAGGSGPPPDDGPADDPSDDDSGD
eukprot:4044225-Heterocapsa_arctica.AAC.1